MKRHRNELRSKTVSQYAIDRSNFTTYLNFSDMYNHIEKIMLKSKIAQELESAVWMSKEGQIVDDEIDAFGYKVTIRMTRPDMALVLDECGCNLSQEGDKLCGGELFLTGKKEKAYSASSTKTNQRIYFDLLNNFCANNFSLISRSGESDF